MKTLLIIAAVFVSMSVAAQRESMVSITVDGSRNKEIRIDGRSYMITSSTTPIQITNLNPGQHTLEIVRATRFGSIISRVTSKTFYLRSGYDMDITVNSSGSVQTSESRIRNMGNYSRRYRNAMSDLDFNRLANDVRYMGRRDRLT